eukprot:gene16908-22397_t
MLIHDWEVPTYRGSNVKKQQSFIQSSNGLLFNKEIIEKSTNYNIKSIGTPRVLAPIEEGDDWKIWFHGKEINDKDDVNLFNAGNGRIYYLTSSNGLTNWIHDEDSPIMHPSKEDGDWWWFDSEHVGIGDIFVPGNRAQEIFITMNGVYIMYIFGGSTSTTNLPNGDIVKGLKLGVGVAVSQDGIHFSKIEGPSISSSILDPGSSDEFDSLFVGWPSIVELSNKFQMYYHTLDTKTNKFSIGLAEATDGILQWVKKGKVFDGGDYNSDSFDNRGASRRHVVRILDGTYRMWYEGISSTGKHFIGLSKSTDGLNWVKVSDEPVLSPNEDPNSWDSERVGSPHVIWLSEKKRWRLYYTGSNKSENSNDTLGISENGVNIGVAESTDEHGTTFHRVNLN